ncbi:hypothetical protein AB1388_31450, partial [Streptomyces hydrogenans]
EGRRSSPRTRSASVLAPAGGDALLTGPAPGSPFPPDPAPARSTVMPTDPYAVLQALLRAEAARA